MSGWRVVGTTAELPTAAYGQRTLLWWGTVAFMVIEGWTLAVCAGAYLYLRAHVGDWPPAETPLPGLIMSSTNVALMLASLGPVWWSARAARRLDVLRARLGLALCSICGIGFLLLRWFEFLSVNTPWRGSGYGSAVWAVLAFHTSLLVVQAAEAIGLTAILLRRPPPVRYLAAVVDFALYWTFLVLLWLPLYLMIDVLPHFGR